VINKKEQEREARRFGGANRQYVSKRSFAFVYAVMAMFKSFFGGLFRRQPEPFVLTKFEGPSGSGRFEGYTFKRVKKVGNFFAYGWVLTDKRKAARV
jgi:hypothetical protein